MIYRHQTEFSPNIHTTRYVSLAAWMSTRHCDTHEFSSDKKPILCFWNGSCLNVSLLVATNTTLLSIIHATTTVHTSNHQYLPTTSNLLLVSFLAKKIIQITPNTNTYAFSPLSIFLSFHWHCFLSFNLEVESFRFVAERRETRVSLLVVVVLPETAKSTVLVPLRSASSSTDRQQFFSRKGEKKEKEIHTRLLLVDHRTTQKPQHHEDVTTNDKVFQVTIEVVVVQVQVEGGGEGNDDEDEDGEESGPGPWPGPGPKRQW